MSQSEKLKVETSAGRCTLTLNRPEVHNALDDELMDALSAAYDAAAADDEVRVIILAGAGKSFCAGGDLNWMKAMVAANEEENIADAARLFGLLERLARGEKPVIARVQGAALGGGMGLVAACDLVVAAPRAAFGLPEVKLGLAPAMIFPFLLRKVQKQHLLAAALTGERFRAERARDIGLVNEVTEDLDAVVDGWVSSLTSGGPAALGMVKELFFQVPGAPWAEARDLCIRTIARARVSEEAQKRMRLFLQSKGEAPEA